MTMFKRVITLTPAARERTGVAVLECHPDDVDRVRARWELSDDDIASDTSASAQHEAVAAALEGTIEARFRHVCRTRGDYEFLDRILDHVAPWAHTGVEFEPPSIGWANAVRWQNTSLACPRLVEDVAAHVASVLDQLDKAATA